MFFVKQTIKIIIGMCLVFVKAESHSQEKGEFLTIGDQLPSLKLNNLAYYDKTKVDTSEFRGKFLILDFWGTWCSSCILAFTKIDSLQKKFQSHLKFLPVTTGNKKNSMQILESLFKIRGIKLPSLLEDTIITKLFDYKYVPHYVWVDNKGIIKAITGTYDLTEENIQKFIHASEVNVKPKIDKIYNYDKSRPLFADKQINPEEHLLYQTTITNYIQEIPTFSKIGKGFIECPNHSIRQLFKLAFGEFELAFLNDNRIVLEGFNTFMDSLEIGIYRPELKSIWRKFQKQFVYCYELAFTDSTLSRKQKCEIMQQDLNKFFGLKGITAKRERRNVKVLTLIRTSKDDKIQTTGGVSKDVYTNYYCEIKNKPIWMFLSKMQVLFTRFGALPIEDATEYKNNIDLKINADLKDINAVNRELEKYDLKLVEGSKELEMIIIVKTKSQ